MAKSHFNQRYAEGDPSWNIRRPDANLIEMVQQWPVTPGSALDIGCGTGDNAIWLAQQGFTVTGIDFSELAIQQAKEKAEKKTVTCRFEVMDFLRSPVSLSPVSFVFDRGCFHSRSMKGRRKKFARKVASLLEPDGFWMSLMGNPERPRRGHGPPTVPAVDIVRAVTPYFDIHLMKRGTFDSDQDPRAVAWICLFQKKS